MQAEENAHGIGCGGEIRTHGLQVMNLTSYQTALLHVIVTRCVQRLHRMQHDGGAVVTAKGRRYLSIPSHPSVR